MKEFTKVHKYIRSMFRQPGKITQLQKENIAEYYKVAISEVDEAINYEVKDDINLRKKKAYTPKKPIKKRSREEILLTRAEKKAKNDA